VIGWLAAAGWLVTRTERLRHELAGLGNWLLTHRLLTTRAGLSTLGLRDRGTQLALVSGNAGVAGVTDSGDGQQARGHVVVPGPVRQPGLVIVTQR
jgi:hypothetical protein